MAKLQGLPPRIGALAPRVQAEPKRADRFYYSPEWRSLVAARKLDADWFAARARAKQGERLILDHVKERKDGGSDLDPANTEWLTFSEHQAKTAKARRRRTHGTA